MRTILAVIQSILTLVKYVVIFVVLFIAVVVGVGFFLPAEWSVERSQIIEASPASIHPYVNDLCRWPEWVPWNTDRDATLDVTYAEQTVGVGAKHMWTSDESGDGELTITASDPARGIEFAQVMDDGQFSAVGEIAYEALEGGTRVRWTDRGEMGWNPLHRWMGLILQKLMGDDFEQGLARLKDAVEQSM
jgi:hypothetical protein